MVYNTQNYWGSGPHPSSGILETKRHEVLETGSVSVLRRWDEDMHLVGSLQSLDPLSLALSKESSKVSVFIPSPEDANKSSFRNVVFYSF
jgi:hypothetical protein